MLGAREAPDSTWGHLPGGWVRDGPRFVSAVERGEVFRESILSARPGPGPGTGAAKGPTRAHRPWEGFRPETTSTAPHRAR